MIDAAENAGRCLMVAQVVRFWDSYQPLIEAQKFEPLGPARAALFRRRCAAPAWSAWLPDRARSGGGVFDLLIHDVDLCVHLFGEPRAVAAAGYEDLAAGLDVLTAHLYYDKIHSVVVTGGWHHQGAYPFSMEYTVSFDGGTIEFSTAGRPATLHAADGAERELPIPDRDGFEAQLRYFIECASTGAPPERCDPRESAAAVRLMLLLLESRRQGGRRIECKP
jgi:predicted dehydrogenase